VSGTIVSREIFVSILEKGPNSFLLFQTIYIGSWQQNRKGNL
jgi:hypothetical protein